MDPSELEARSHFLPPPSHRCYVAYGVRTMLWPYFTTKDAVTGALVRRSGCLRFGHARQEWWRWTAAP